MARAVRKAGHARQEGWHRRFARKLAIALWRFVERCRAGRRDARPNRKGSKFESLPLIRQGGLATGKIDGSLQPRSSLVAARAFQAPAYVNSDCGTKAMTFDRIQVNALVRMVTAEAGMVTFCIRVRMGCQYKGLIAHRGYLKGTPPLNAG